MHAATTALQELTFQNVKNDQRKDQPLGKGCQFRTKMGRVGMTSVYA